MVPEEKEGSQEPSTKNKAQNSRRSRNKGKRNGRSSNGNNTQSKIQSKLDEYDKTKQSAKTVTGEQEPAEVVRKSNDPAWYLYSPEQVASVAKIPFAEAFGDILPAITIASVNTINDKQFNVYKSPVVSVPGIAVCRTRPTFGSNFLITDPLNVAATELYTFVRYTNNGRKNYDAPDLMMHVLAIADTYSYVMWLKKIYGLAFIYSTRNFYYGKAILYAMGIDAEDIVHNLANFRYWLNTYINKISAYVVPDTINLLKRRSFLYADVYTESETENVKDQLYTFTPDGFFKFDFDSDGAGMLKYIHTKDAANGERYTFSQLMNLGEDLLSNITQDEDFGLMSGDLLKAFANNIIKVDPLPEEYIIDPHYDHEVLHQIMNASVDLYYENKIDNSAVWGIQDPIDPTQFKWSRSFQNGNVYQLPNGILVHGFLIPESPGESSSADDLDLNWEVVRRNLNVLLNSDLPQITEEQVMEMTRMSTSIMKVPSNVKMTGLHEGDELRDAYALSTGSDIMVSITIARYDANANLHIPNNNLSLYRISKQIVPRSDGAISINDGAYQLRLKCAFKYLPAIYEISYLAANEQDPGEFKILDIWQNLENYTYIDPVQLDRIHRVALYSLCHVPGVARNILS